jgi:hypothetical protein
MAPEIGLDTWVKIGQELAACEVDGEVVILGLEGNQYYSLDDVGARIWQLLAEPRPVAAILDVLVREYETTAEECGPDLLALLGELRAEKLIEVLDAAPA